LSGWLTHLGKQAILTNRSAVYIKDVAHVRDGYQVQTNIDRQQRDRKLLLILAGLPENLANQAILRSIDLCTGGGR
jgi:hypothetical protein